MNTGSIIDANIGGNGKKLLWTQGRNGDWNGVLSTQDGLIIGLVALMICIALTLAIFAVNYGIEKVKQSRTESSRSGYQSI